MDYSVQLMVHREGLHNTGLAGGLTYENFSTLLQHSSVKIRRDMLFLFLNRGFGALTLIGRTDGSKRLGCPSRPKRGIHGKHIFRTDKKRAGMDIPEFEYF